MSQRITIGIKDKIATCLSELPVVCGNADYVVDFAFDEEWENHEIKTAIFVVNGKSIPQVFAGNVCPMPVIQNTLIAWVGVFAGTVDDGTLSTSTPALVKCIPCITDGDSVPMAPPDDVYNQIIALVESGMLKGEQGEKGDKGDKGDAGVIKFIPVTRTENENPIDDLPKENIDTSAIYLLPIDKADEQNRFTEYAYIDGKWEILGAISIQVDHSEYVKFTDAATPEKVGVVRVGEGLNISSSSSKLNISTALQSHIDAKSTSYRPITPAYLDYATMKALSDCKAVDEDGNSIWTDDTKDDSGNVVKGTKTKACETIGAESKIPTFKSGRYRFKTRGPNDGESIIEISNYGNVPSGYGMSRANANGNMTVADPVEPMDGANKKYVDNAIANAGVGGGGSSKKYRHTMRLLGFDAIDEIEKEFEVSFVSSYQSFESIEDMYNKGELPKLTNNMFEWFELKYQNGDFTQEPMTTVGVSTFCTNGMYGLVTVNMFSQTNHDHSWIALMEIVSDVSEEI